MKIVAVVAIMAASIAIAYGSAGTGPAKEAAAQGTAPVKTAAQGTAPVKAAAQGTAPAKAAAQGTAPAKGDAAQVKAPAKQDRGMGR